SGARVRTTAARSTTTSARQAAKCSATSSNGGSDSLPASQASWHPSDQNPSAGDRIVWHELVVTLRSFVRRREFESALGDELRDHLARESEHRIAAGASATEAGRAALADLGGVERMKDELRETYGVDHADGLLRDLRYALRRVRHAPLYAMLVVL